MPTYNKLVRDKIPKIIEQDGKKVKGITWSHIRDIQDNKRKKNGGFNKKYFLISVEG